MREVSGAVIATCLVLVAVFLPVAFFPGTTGPLYPQFALTIAAVGGDLHLLRPHPHPGAERAAARTREPPQRAVLLVLREGHRRRHPGLRRGAAPRACAARWAVVLLFVGALGLTYWVYRTVPQAFVPEEDQGYFLMQVQAPAGASLEYTGNVARQAEKIIMADPDVLALFSVMGFSFSGAAPNQGLMFARLKPFEDRPGDGALGAGGPRPARRAALQPAGRDRRRLLRRRRSRA